MINDNFSYNRHKCAVHVMKKNSKITMLEKFHLSAGIQLRIMVIYESAVIWC